MKSGLYHLQGRHGVGAGGSISSECEQQSDYTARDDSGLFELLHVNMRMGWLHTLAVGCHEYWSVCAEVWSRFFYTLRKTFPMDRESDVCLSFCPLSHSWHIFLVVIIKIHHLKPLVEVASAFWSHFGHTAWHFVWLDKFTFVKVLSSCNILIFMEKHEMLEWELRGLLFVPPRCSLLLFSS